MKLTKRELLKVRERLERTQIRCNWCDGRADYYFITPTPPLGICDTCLQSIGQDTTTPTGQPPDDGDST
jgi:hypothetical protein